MIAAIHLSFGQVAASLALVGVAALVSLWQHADLERDIAVATFRSFVQLTAIGYVIKFIFDQDNLVFVLALIAGMVVFGAFTAQSRARRVPNAFWPLLIALALAGTTTLALVVALGVFPATPRYLVPVGGMVIGNSMTAAAVTLNSALLGSLISSYEREWQAGEIDLLLARLAAAGPALEDRL
jgi:putative ABC transport system permease protein